MSSSLDDVVSGLFFLSNRWRYVHSLECLSFKINLNLFVSDRLKGEDHGEIIGDDDVGNTHMHFFKLQTKSEFDTLEIKYLDKKTIFLTKDTEILRVDFVKIKIIAVTIYF